jgi:hypothetical protein
MDGLADIIRKVMLGYVGGGLDLKVFPLFNEEEQVYAVVVVDWPVHRRPAAFVVLARVENERVIIEADLTDRPLVDAFVRAGIPREQIVLAYVGEPMPA